MRYRRLTPIGYAARRCDPVPMECEDLLHMRTDFSHGREVFERRLRSDCVHEQVAKRTVDVRFTGRAGRSESHEMVKKMLRCKKEETRC